jgi:hypothetical protein
LCAIQNAVFAEIECITAELILTMSIRIHINQILFKNLKSN